MDDFLNIIGSAGADGYMEYMGYRNMLAEDAIQDCIDAAHAGADHFTLDAGDFTDEELDYIKSEVRRRLG